MKKLILSMIICFGTFAKLLAQNTNLDLNAKELAMIKTDLNKYQLLEKSYKDLKKLADKAIKQPIEVPLPTDQAGGYTHEKHKQNYYAIQAAGYVYSIEKKEVYAKFVKDILLEYANLIPTLKNHPKAKGSSPGRLFHQALNDCNWIVYAVQGYESIYPQLSDNERKTIENGAFGPLCNFITKDLQTWFDLIHNHGVWACAAVGMVGYTINDKDLIDKALYGSLKNKKSGYFAQMSQLFSPDGYYVEGAYYARYALFPFMMLANVIEKYDPALKVFEYRNQLLKKACNATLQQTYTNGEFFPINDAMKDKNWESRELVLAIGVYVEKYGLDKTLLPIVKAQGRVSLNMGGLVLAKSMAENKEIPAFDWKSVNYSDGPDGKSGGLGILRKGEMNDQFCAVFKYTSHGLSHGHYDRLNLLLYDQGNEILPDYGAARFLNVEPKFGGRYLPENDTYASQSIAHNTLIVDEKSHYDAKESKAEASSPKLIYANLENPNRQIISAMDSTAYKGVKMSRTLVLLQDSTLKKPILIDLMNVVSETEHQYDLAYHYLGHLISTNYKYEAATNTMTTLGTKAGYEHLWKESEAKSKSSIAQITFIDAKRFYTITTTTDTATTLFMARSGANDPNFNLRHEPSWIVRTKGKNKLFASVIEPHGEYDGKLETASGASNQIKNISVERYSKEQIIVNVETKDNRKWTLLISEPAFINTKKKTIVNGKTVEWEGFSLVVSSNK
jgi:oligo-alginate lyase